MFENLEFDLSFRILIMFKISCVKLIQFHLLKCNFMNTTLYNNQLYIISCSSWAMINKETRRLSKFPDEVLGEIAPYFVDAPPVVDDDYIKLPKLKETTADYVLNGLTVSQPLSFS